METAWTREERRLYDVSQGSLRNRLPSFHGLSRERDRKKWNNVREQREKLTKKYTAMEWQALNDLLHH